MEKTVIMNFSGVYELENFYTGQSYEWIDLTDLQGVNCYCTEEAEAEIKKRLEKFSPSGLHFLDSGNYHYASKFWLEKLETPCSLLVFDHHTDMQESAFFGLLSCGSWIRELLKQKGKVREICIVGPPKEAFSQCEERELQQITFISEEELKDENLEKLKAFLKKDNIPLYLSIDKDILCAEDAKTNWDQGEVLLRELQELLSLIFEYRKILGADICGENPQSSGTLPLTEELRVNEKTNQILWNHLKRYL